MQPAIDYEYERQRHRQPVHALRAARRLAPRQGHRPPTPPSTTLTSLKESGRSSHFPHAKHHPRSSRTISISTSKASLYEAFRGRRSQTARQALRIGTIRPNTAVGSIIAESETRCSLTLNVSIAAIRRPNRPSSRKSPLGNTTEMPITQKQIGNSQPNPLKVKLKYLYPSI